MNHPLVPAKAGTQFFAKHWMPASAGMSGESQVLHASGSFPSINTNAIRHTVLPLFTHA
jgi:hypothetical protein